MDKTTRTVVWVVIALVVIGLVYAMAKRSDNQQASNGDKMVAGETYKVGFSFPLTGDAASYGEPARNVVQLAIDEINDIGGVNGKKLEAIFEDDKCNGKDAANAAQKLVNVDRVQVIIGSMCSSASLAEVPIVTAGKIVMFSPGSTNPGLTGISKYFFRNIPSDASQGAVDAEFVYKRGLRKAAFIVESKDYPLGIYKAFSERFQQLGGTTLKEEFPTDATDFRTQLTKLRSQNPDLLFIDPQAPASAERILKQLKDLGWKVQLMINEATAGDQKTIADNKDMLEGAYGAEFVLDQSNSKLQHLLESYKKRYGGELPFQSYGSTEYDAVYLIRDGIAAVGYDGEKLADWSRTVKDWDGASGKTTIKSDGDRESGYSSEIVKDGKMTVYKE